jgi:hypothetical protein
VAPNVPAAQISVWASTPGFVQPCAVTAAVTDNIEVDVELVSQASIEADARLPRTASGPILSGVVFETTSNGRMPVARATDWAEDSVGVTLATTQTDINGCFLVCNLPGSAWLTISEPGFQLVSRPATDLSASVFELELKRNP